MTTGIVWLASYPKSGNTWMRALLAALEHGEVGLDTTIRGSMIASARGPLERMTGLVSSEMRDDEIARLRPLVDEQLEMANSTSDSRSRPRKIHDALFVKEGGPPIVSPRATAAAIYLIRDPRDVAVSYAHHMGRPVEEVVKVMSDAGAHSNRAGTVTRQLPQILGTWSSHVEGWLDHQLFPVLLVRYEDMIDDPVTQLARVTDLLNHNTTPDELAAAVAASSFDNLQAQEATTGFREAMSPDRPFFRQGMAGSWRKELPAELARIIERDHARVMERFGYQV